MLYKTPTIHSQKLDKPRESVCSGLTRKILTSIQKTAGSFVCRLHSQKSGQTNQVKYDIRDGMKQHKMCLLPLSLILNLRARLFGRISSSGGNSEDIWCVVVFILSWCITMVVAYTVTNYYNTYAAINDKLSNSAPPWFTVLLTSPLYKDKTYCWPNGPEILDK